MATAAPRLGKLDTITVNFLTDIVLLMESDSYMDAFDDLVNIDFPDDDDSDAAMDVWDNELDRLQQTVMNRVARALMNMTTGKSDQDRLVREMNRILSGNQEPSHHALIFQGDAPTPPLAVYGVGTPLLSDH